MGALALSTADLRVFGDEPRVNHRRLAEVLGFARDKNVRRLITRHFAELQRYGQVVTQSDAKPHKSDVSGGRPADIVLLNEAQSLLICMFARTNAAAEVRTQVIKVFLAYRHGKLDQLQHPRPASNENGLWDDMAKRHELALGVTKFEALTKTLTFSRALAFMPPSWKGDRRRNAKPKFWGDMEVRIALCELYREMTINDAHLLLTSKYGEDRTPSRSAIGRFWQWLDRVFEVRAA